ncbi:hypothetical protein BOTBODRAFT_358582 [Botryobasidium botryosum FD-172 SS1]|uniref:Uncharacterized protein n=1 Tax=Botryobasidium botryosum (strain FD-172 SS1) TaxID=930990 RepID=A0A067MR41_BOTB1|nr:hypothetical protein BOTBODRAFT_358582 [Botryobasidium botryosum FD-172 SS1]
MKFIHLPSHHGHFISFLDFFHLPFPLPSLVVYSFPSIRRSRWAPIVRRLSPSQFVPSLPSSLPSPPEDDIYSPFPFQMRPWTTWLTRLFLPLGITYHRICAYRNPHCAPPQLHHRNRNRHCYLDSTNPCPCTCLRRPSVSATCRRSLAHSRLIIHHPRRSCPCTYSSCRFPITRFVLV